MQQRCFEHNARAVSAHFAAGLCDESSFGDESCTNSALGYSSAPLLPNSTRGSPPDATELQAGITKAGCKPLPEHCKVWTGRVCICSKRNNNRKPSFLNETSNSVNFIEFQSQAALALVKCLKCSAYTQLVGTVFQLMMLQVVSLPPPFAVPGAIWLLLPICSLHASTKEVVFKDKSLTLPAPGRSP